MAVCAVLASHATGWTRWLKAVERDDWRLVANLFITDLYARHNQKIATGLDNRPLGHCLPAAHPGHTQYLAARATRHESAGRAANCRHVDHALPNLEINHWFGVLVPYHSFERSQDAVRCARSRMS